MDYSGRDFDAVYLIESKALSHAFLNGVSISNSIFAHVAFDQCEFGEAQITHTHFVEVLLDGADFVRATMSGGSFQNCDLTDGEWRESIFQNVKFIDCKFAHTTVNLCRFFSCEFDAVSIAGFDYKAVNYNVFSNCTFEKGIASETVLARNFGLRAANASVALVLSGTLTLEQLCRMSGSRPVKVWELVQAIDHECVGFHGRLKKVRLEFISNLIGALASEQRLSPASLMYIEGIFTKAARVALEHGDIQALLLIIITIRNDLVTLINKILEYAPSELQTRCLGIVIEYNESFSKDDATAWTVALDHILTDGRSKISLSSFQGGSTILGIDLSDIFCSAATVLAALNLLLSQIKVSILRYRDLKRTLVRSKSAANSTKRRRKAQSQISALLWSEKPVREVVRLRTAVARRGKVLVRLDEPARLTLRIAEKEKMPATRD